MGGLLISIDVLLGAGRGCLLPRASAAEVVAVHGGHGCRRVHAAAAAETALVDVCSLINVGDDCIGRLLNAEVEAPYEVEDACAAMEPPRWKSIDARLSEV